MKSHDKLHAVTCVIAVYLNSHFQFDVT